jgi:hypothetical protein
MVLNMAMAHNMHVHATKLPAPAAVRHTKILDATDRKCMLYMAGVVAGEEKLLLPRDDSDVFMANECIKRLATTEC